MIKKKLVSLSVIFMIYINVLARYFGFISFDFIGYLYLLFYSFEEFKENI